MSRPRRRLGVAALPFRILIVDDDSACRRFFSDLLERNGYQALAAHDGQEGLALARRIRPELVLLDLSLPRQNGIEVMRRMRTDPRTAGARLVLMTGVRDPKSLLSSACEAIPTCVFLRKPITGDRLLRVIRKELEAKEAAANGISVDTLAPARVKVDSLNRRAWINGRLIWGLGPRRFELLAELCRRPEGASKLDLLAAIWGPGHDSKVVDRTVQRLRVDLGDTRRELILALPGGYKLTRSR